MTGELFLCIFRRTQYYTYPCVYIMYIYICVYACMCVDGATEFELVRCVCVCVVAANLLVPRVVRE